VRRSLGIPDQARLVVLTMGGVGWTYRGLAAAERHRRAWFAVPGGAERPRRRGRVVLLPFHSQLFHPDLVQAADVVVGKLGYSTVAETYQARSAMAFVGRPHFRESQVLAEFVRRTAPSTEITEAAFNDGSWIDAVDSLLDAERPTGPRVNGAGEAAAAILERFGAALR
jgi:predicted glycosyltransferase